VRIHTLLNAAAAAPVAVGAATQAERFSETVAYADLQMHGAASSFIQRARQFQK
jgi:hypothetical protein